MAKLRPVSIIIAIASVAILVFVPLFSDSSDPHLYDVLEVFFDKPSTIEAYSIMLPIAMLFCTLILLVTSIIGKKSALIGGAAACIVIFCGVIFAQFFITKYNQFSGFGDYMSLVFESFGFNIWAQIVIYVISLILGIVSPKKANAQFRYAQPGPYSQYNNGQPFGQQQPPFGQQQPPFGQQQQPYGQPQPFGQPQQPFGQQQPPFAQQQAPFAQQQAPYQQPEQPFAQPQAPYQQPEQPFAQPQAPYQQPEQPFAQPQDEIPTQDPIVREAPQPEAENGTPEADNSVSAPAPAVCPNCGSEIMEGASFCTNCGSKI